ncbi:MAG: tetratricopeptide repeat protein [Deltaproteobacteria bacterium]|nr:tetratricopeptide repeat protein [Deltaproteobacteria bacterium]
MKRSRSVISLTVVFVAGFLSGILFSAWKLEKLEHPSDNKQVAQKQQDAKEVLRGRIADTERMLARDPNNLAALVQLGNDQFDAGNYEAAIAAYERALKIEPRDPDVITDMGIALRRAQRPLEAVGAFRKALEADPNHPLAMFNLGLVLRDDLKDYDGALKAWEMFLEKASDSPHAVMVRPWVKQLREKIGASQDGGAASK